MPDDDILAVRPLQNAARISFLLAVMKGIAYLATGSLVVLAAFLDSAADACLSWLQSKIHKASLGKADKEHPYGHGGYEVLGAFAQGGVISVGAGIMFFAAFERLRNPWSADVDIAELPLGIFVLAIGALGGLGIYLHLKSWQRRLTKAHHFSAALTADSAHYLSDVYSNGLALIGLIGVYVTHQTQVDTIFGLLASVILAATALPVFRKVVRDVLHTESDLDVQMKIKTIALEANPLILGVHRLRCREMGPILFADFHLKLPAATGLVRAHHIEEKVRSDLTTAFPTIDVFIHLDPDTEVDEESY